MRSELGRVGERSVEAEPPEALREVTQARTAPGTVTERGPVSSTRSSSSTRGERPDPLSPWRRPSCQTSANASPPTPLSVGSATASTAAAAIAASTALPPSPNAARPAAVASGWLVAIIASPATAGILRHPLGCAAPARKSASRSSFMLRSWQVCARPNRAIMGVVELKRPRTPHYDDPVAVGRRLHEARETAGISQRELAFPGCSAAYISRIERGERIPSLQVMRELARRIGISESSLAYGRERIDAGVSDAMTAVEAAEAAGDQDELAKAYRALSRAATHAAKTRSAA